MLGKNINLPVIQGYWNLEIKINQFWTNFFVNSGPKNFFLIFTFESHSNIYIGNLSSTRTTYYNKQKKDCQFKLTLG